MTVKQVRRSVVGRSLTSLFAVAFAVQAIQPAAVVGSEAFSDFIRISGTLPEVLLLNSDSQRVFSLGVNPFRFYIKDDDRSVFEIDNGAPGASFKIAASGFVGLGAANPQQKLHLVSGALPSIRLEEANSAQKWDISAGAPGFAITDETTGWTPLTMLPSAPNGFVAIQGDLAVSNGDMAVTNGNLGVFNGEMAVFDGATANYKLTTTAGTSRLGMNTAGLYLISNVAGDHTRFFTNDGPGSLERLRIQSNGNVAIGVTSASTKLQVVNARCNGSAWIDASSRKLKQAIRELDSDQAQAAFAQLQPVTFAYKDQPDEPRVGFIAEDVPELVATNDRQGLSSMDVVAVLTRVVQEQDKTIGELSERLSRLEAKLAAP